MRLTSQIKFKESLRSIKYSTKPEMAHLLHWEKTQSFAINPFRGCSSQFNDTRTIALERAGDRFDKYLETSRQKPK